MFVRAISTSAVHYAQAKPTPLIKRFPVTLHFLYPFRGEPVSHEFSSAQAITNYLSEQKQFLMDRETGHAIRADQVDRIDPEIIYEIAGSGLSYREKGLTREQVWDKVFERKADLALGEVLEADDPGIVELPRVIKNAAGKDVSKWEAIYQLSDGCIIFLEAKYRMSKAHVDSQLKRMSQSLDAMGTGKRARLYLAAFYWPDDEDSVSYARNKGYGIIQPNGSDLSVHFKAKELDLRLIQES